MSGQVPLVDTFKARPGLCQYDLTFGIPDLKFDLFWSGQCILQ